MALMRQHQERLDGLGQWPKPADRVRDAVEYPMAAAVSDAVADLLYFTLAEFS